MSCLPEYVQRVGSDKWRIRIWVQPRAKKAGILGSYQDCLKIKLQSPPVDNKANLELIKFVAKKLGLKPVQINLEQGQSSRKKSLLIESAKEPLWSILEGQE